MTLMAERIETLFLDTSVQTERVLTEPGLLEKVETTLRLPLIQAVTSDYVWMEICDLVRSGVVPQEDNTYAVASTCRKEHAACHLAEFLRAQQTNLHAIADYLADHPNAIKGQARVTQLLAALLHDPRAALGQAACWPLGI